MSSIESETPSAPAPGDSYVQSFARGLAVIRLGLTPSKLDYRPQTLVRRILDVLDAAEAQAPT